MWDSTVNKTEKDKNPTWPGSILALKLMLPLWQLSFVWHNDLAAVSHTIT